MSSTLVEGSPVFLLAHERSGTNLLRRILGRHSAIAAPPPTHLLEWLARYEPFYGSLADDRAFSQLVRDALKVTSLSFEPWPTIASADEICRSIPAHKRSLMSLYLWLHDGFAAATGRSRWFCKDKNLIAYAGELALRVPEGRFIFMHRDPRDVYASYKRAPGGYKHPMVFVADWDRMHRATLRFVQSDVIRDRCLRLSYEELTSDPAATTARLCAFLGETYDPQMLETPGELRTDNSYWRNLASPISASNSAKYEVELTRREVRMIEYGAYDTMVCLGYSPRLVMRGRSPRAVRAGAALVVDRSLQRWRARTAKVGEHERATVRKRQMFRRELSDRRWTDLRESHFPQADGVEAFSVVGGGDNARE